jgi:hypothetical protein
MVWQVSGRSAGKQPALRWQDDRLTPAGGQKCHLRRHGQTSQGMEKQTLFSHHKEFYFEKTLK